MGGAVDPCITDGKTDLVMGKSYPIIVDTLRHCEKQKEK